MSGLPAGWTEVALGDVCEVNPKPRSLPGIDEKVAFLGMASVHANGTTDRGELRRFGDVSKGYTQFERGDVLVAKITPCFENGKIAQADPRTPVAAGSTEFHVVRPREDVDARYLLHYLRQPWVRLAGERRMTGSGGQRRVPASFVATLQLPLPPLEEQRRIAAILDKADELRARRRAALEQLDSLTQAIFLDMFGDRESAQRRFEIRSLAEVVDPSTSVTYGIVQAGPEVPGGIPYIRTGDIVQGAVCLDRLRHTSADVASRFERSAVRAGDIVMSIRATVGTTALVPPSLDGANLTQGTARIAPGPTVDRAYLLEELRSPGAQSWIQRQVKGATFREITLTRLREMPVRVPSLESQRAFAELCKKCQGLAATANASYSVLDEQFSSLQSRAFRGEL